MNRRPLLQIILGIVVVAIGVSALLSALGVADVDLGRILSTWWPSLIILAGLAALVTVPRAWIGPVTLLAVGVVLQLAQLGVVDVKFWELIWPVALILVGLSLLTKGATGGTEDRTINSAVLWWGADRRTRSQDFRGGSLSAVMGGIEVDLREAGIVDRAEMSVFTLWGGVEIKVPPTWQVTVQGLPLLGGWENKTTSPADPAAPELLVHVTAIMGGVEIKH